MSKKSITFTFRQSFANVIYREIKKALNTDLAKKAKTFDNQFQ